MIIPGIIWAALRWVGGGLLDLFHLIPREWLDRIVTAIFGGVIAWSWCYVHYNIPALRADHAALLALQRSVAAGDKLARDREAAAQKASWAAGYDAGMRFQDIASRLNPLIVKVPYYVTKEADAACPVPWGFVRLWDAITTGSDIDTVRARIAPGQPDDARSDVTLSEIVTLHGAIAGVAHHNATQLNGLTRFEKQVAE